MDDLDPALLSDRWVSVPEEAGADELVFVGAEHAAVLPPARGRQSFRLAPDGTAEVLGPGADDRPVSTDGRWELTGRHLSVRAGTQTHELDIDTLERGRLVARTREEE